MRQVMDPTKPSLELQPMDQPQPEAPAPKAAAEIDIPALGKAPAAPAVAEEKIDPYLR